MTACIYTLQLHHYIQTSIMFIERVRVSSLLLSSFLITGFLSHAFGFDGKPKLVADEVNALRVIGAKLGKNDWDFSVDPCSKASSWYSKDEPKRYENQVICDCSYNSNSTCHVSSISLKGQDLSGILPPEFDKLPFLKNLSLVRNILSGSLPSQWHTIRLEYLSLFGNRFSGPFPKVLSSITSLRNLNIEGNRFSGALPMELGNLIGLETLVISSNQFTGQLPKSLRNLSKLRELKINDNNFSGRIPDFFGSWPHMEKLHIQGSSFEGPIPGSISALKNLTDLRISDLRGRGSDFPQLSTMKSLKYLILRKCSIYGVIPGYIGDMKALEFLDLSFNNLTRISESFYIKRTVKFLYFTGNMLTGALPRWISESNRVVDISSNNFTWESSSPKECPQSMSNLVESHSTQKNELSDVQPCLKKGFPCDSSEKIYSLRINCGGDQVYIDDNTKYESDTEPKGSSTYYRGRSQNWAFSSTGTFIDNVVDGDLYTKVNTSTISGISNLTSELYTTARVSPLSLTYYGLCLGNGNYTVRLHFAEIYFWNDSTFFSIGKRLFDVYIQEKLVLQDFNIEEEAGGSNKPIVKSFTTSVESNTLKIQFYWAGKGTTGIPYIGVYGPLISAISIDPNFDPPVKKISPGLVVGIVFIVLGTILIILGVLWWKGCIGRRNEIDQELRGLHITFSSRQIKAATNNFDLVNKIGEGGFGSVYKGVLLDGTVIAVKQLFSKSKQGNLEFVNEIGMISALQHPNLVRLYGCCIEGNQLLLVYEYLENNNLERALFGHEERQLKLDWPIRRKICIDIARALAYLHEESTLKIVHRDVKTANILLDKDLNAKLSDFGLAKLDHEDNTHISTRVAGTIGYMAPEYALRGYLTNKADVYGFGVVTLEIVSGRSNCNYRPKAECINLLDWALILRERGNLMDLVDPRLESCYVKEEVLEMINIVLLCTNVSPTLRPTMSSVVNMLEGRSAVSMFITDSSTSNGDMKLKVMRDHYQHTLDLSMTDSQTQSLSMDPPWTEFSISSAGDLYPPYPDSESSDNGD